MMSIPENIVEMGKAALAELDKAMATNKQLLSFQKKNYTVLIFLISF